MNPNYHEWIRPIGSQPTDRRLPIAGDRRRNAKDKRPYISKKPYMLRDIENKDLDTLAYMHRDYISGALLPKMGHGFLRALYAAMMKSERCRVVLWDEDGEILGYIAATDNTGGMLKRVLFEDPVAVAGGVVKLIAEFPRQVNALYETFTYARASEDDENTGELLFIALKENVRRAGISDEMVKDCVRWLEGRRVEKVKVVTDLDNRGANALLKRCGFYVGRSDIFREKEINVYYRDLG